MQATEKVYQGFWLEVSNPAATARCRARTTRSTSSPRAGATREVRVPGPAQRHTRALLRDARRRSRPARTPPTCRRSRGEAGSGGRRAAVGIAAVSTRSCARPASPTRLEGGHADNALPQLARAIVNCRHLPGHARRGRADRLSTRARGSEDRRHRRPRDTGSAPSPLHEKLFAAVEALTRSSGPACRCCR